MKPLLVSGFVAVLFAPSLAAQLPDTPPGRIAAAWFAAVNGDDATALAFEQKHRAAAKLEERSAAQRVATYKQIRGTVGALAPRSVVAASEHEIVVLAEAEKVGMTMRCRFEIDSAPPHKLITVEVRPGGDPAAKARSYSGFEDLPDLLARVRADAKFPAIAAAVVEGEEIVARAVAGVRVAGEKAVAELGDRFHIGSITKPITATMIGRLVERGVLALDVTLLDALPDIDMRAEYRAVTLAQLLQHRAGIPPYTSDDKGEGARLDALPGDRAAQRAAFVAEVLQQEPTGKAGAHFEYSNAGYVIAGHIAEVATNKPWETLVREEVFVPLGMASADIGWPATSARPDQPRGHAGERPLALGEGRLGAWLAPAGDVCCSIEDLARFASAHLRGLRGEDGLLRAATVELLHTPPEAASGRQVYAHGWVVRRDGGEPIHWHNGSAGTFFAQVELAPQGNRAFAVAVNAMTPDAQLAIEAVLAALRERYRD